MGEWKSFQVGEIGKVITGKTPKTSISDNYGGYIPFLTPSDDMSVKYVRKTAKTLTEKGLSEVKNAILPANSVCVSCIGSDLGKVVITTRPTVTNQQINSIVVDEARFDISFVYYAMRILGKKLNFISKTSTAVPIVNKSSFSSYEIECPPLKEQKQIAAVLSVLDAKIECNRMINDNLQQQLTAIYKSWYQDFSLVNDTELVETAYGTIPKGWHYVLLGDLCQSISVTHKFDKNALIFLNTGDVEDGRFLHSNLMAVKEMPGQAKKTIAPGDILYSEIRPINRHFAYVIFPSDDYVVSTKLMVIRAKNFDTRRLYHYLTSENVLNELQLQAESRSGTFPQIRFENVSKLPILIADEQTESEFVKILHTVFDQIEQLNRENKQLSELRDTLLPKLMSGEIDVSDIQL